MRRLWPVLICAMAACGDSEGEAAVEERSPQAVLASRHACAAEELARTADEDLATIQSGLGAAGAVEGLTAFARAYQQHAELRLLAYAKTDSALNHSRDSQDSTRYAQAASELQIILPRAGTLEANVMASYDQKAAAILADADHPCNWKHELSE
jgi:hypothetical protein